MSNPTVTICTYLARVAFATLAVCLFFSYRWPVFSFDKGYTPSEERITLFSSAALETPKNVFKPGEKVWASSALSPANYGTGSAQRRIQWITPEGFITQQREITANNPTDSYQIPSSATVGTWSVKIVDVSNVGIASVKFIVRDPANRATDLTVTVSAAQQVTAGEKVTYELTLTNSGPDDAEDVELVDATSKGMTFLSMNNPPEWNCSASDDKASCNIPHLANGVSASLTVTYQVSDAAQSNARITNTVVISSRTAELHKSDNSSSVVSTILATACTLGCPEDITRSFEPGLNGATVSYADPSASQSCAKVTCNPASGSFFPAGVTTVVCSSINGEACSFKVTITGTVSINVIGANPLLVECNTEFRDAEATAQNGNGDTIPVTSSGYVDTSKPGTYTITYSAEEGASTAKATRTVEVVDATPPTISSSAEIIALADASCQAEVPNLIGKVKVFDACASAETLEVTQTPKAGTIVGVGITTITITAKDAAKNASTATVSFLVNPISLDSLTASIGTKGAEDAGVTYDFLAEVLKNDKLIASNRINEVSAENNEAAKASAQIFNLSSSEQVFFCKGDKLSVRLSVRVSASSKRRNGTARLWLSEAAAVSNLTITIGGVASNYSLLNGFTLGVASPVTPTQVTDKLSGNSIDLFVDRATSGNTFKSFGVWSKIF